MPLHPTFSGKNLLIFPRLFYVQTCQKRISWKEVPAKTVNLTVFK
jgi:hypothetical protein